MCTELWVTIQIKFPGHFYGEILVSGSSTITYNNNKKKKVDTEE